MSGNKYTRTVNQLESELAAKLAEVKLLQDENSRLRARDRALTTFTGGVDSGSGVESSLLASTSGSSAALAACSGDGSTAPLQPSDDTAKRIAAIERQVQALLGQIGPGVHDELYSSRLLRAAAARPAAAVAHLALDAPARRTEWAGAVRQLALLLPKYDFGHQPPPASSASGSSAPTTTASKGGAGGGGDSGSSRCASPLPPPLPPPPPPLRPSSTREQVHALVDGLATRALLSGALAGSGRLGCLEDLLVNCETGKHEQYPPGWWHNVLQGLDLSAEQRNTLNIAWERVRAVKAKLAAAHQTALSQLRALQRRNHAAFVQFEARAAEMMMTAGGDGSGSGDREQERLVQDLAALRAQLTARGLLLRRRASNSDSGSASANDSWNTPPLPHSSTADDGRSPESSGQQLAQLALAALAADTAAPLQQQQQQQQHPQQQQQHPDYGKADLSFSLCCPPLQPLDEFLQQLAEDEQDSLLLLESPLGGLLLPDDEAAHKLPLPPLLPPSPLPPPLVTQQQQQQQQQQWSPPPPVQPNTPQPGGAKAAAAAAVHHGPLSAEPPGPVTPHEELLLHLGCAEQAALERALDRANSGLRQQHHAQALQIVNTLTRRQLATLYVLSWPYMPDAFSLCEELEVEKGAAEEAAVLKIEPGTDV